MDREYCVYKHTSPSKKVYIGITQQNPEKRWQCGDGYSYNTHFANAIKKYGWNNFKHEILFSGLTESEARSKEIELIAQYDSTNRNKGYNVSPGGSVMSEESKEKVRRTRKENGTDKRERKRMLSVWADPEKRKKIVERMQNKPRTEEQKEHYRASNARRGKHLTEEQKFKLRIQNSLRRGELASRAKAVCQISPVDGEIVKVFPTARQAAIDMGNKSICAISNACRGQGNVKHFMHGYYWCYEEDYDSFIDTIELNPVLTENGKIKRKPEENWFYGKPMSDEQKEKISLAHRKSVMCIETGIVYKSLIEAANANGIKSGTTISRCINGKIKSAGGHTWKYAELIEEAKLLGD